MFKSLGSVKFCLFKKMKSSDSRQLG